MTRLHELYAKGGQSPWVDNLKRSWLTGDHLGTLIEEGIRGLTSNPTIMAKAIEEGSDYDQQFESSYGEHHNVLDAYWDLVVKDVSDALEQFANPSLLGVLDGIELSAFPDLGAAIGSASLILFPDRYLRNSYPRRAHDISHA